MAVRMLRRVAAMDRAELEHRASTYARQQASRFGALIRKPSWQRSDLTASLRDDVSTLRPAIASLERHDWESAHRALIDHFAPRAGRFPIDAAQRSKTVETILAAFPGAAADATARGDAVLEGRFTLLGYEDLPWTIESEKASGEAPDWHWDPVHRCRAPLAFWSRVAYLDPACGDHKVIWELNRHQYWLQLGRAYWLSGDTRYRDAFAAHLASWMSANPPLMGINWASMLELGLRSISWIWAIHFFTAFSGSPELDRFPWTVDLLLGLDRQMRLVAENLSRYFSPNTHLLGEALALYVVGRTLPELRRAADWERLGREVLIDQADKQINADGGHAELSTHYHRYTLDFYLLALAVARKTADPIADVFTPVVGALARFARAMADDQGRLAGFGDDDGGQLLTICGRPSWDASDSLQIAATMLGQPALAVGHPAEEVVWMTGRTTAATCRAQDAESIALRDSGYFVSRTPRGDHLVIDAGRHGFLNGGHAHADALSVTLTVRGRPLFIDPGTGCYTIDAAVRDRFRSSASHNTLTLDGRSQSVPAGPFHWRSTADGRSLDWQSHPTFDYFEGSHDGYGPLVHHRTVLARPGCWWIVDRVTGSSGPLQHIDAHWHLDPRWHATSTPEGNVRAESDDGYNVWVLSAGGRMELIDGWCAPLYGRFVRTTTLRSTCDERTPIALITVVIDSPEVAHSLQTLPVTVNGHVDPLAIGARLVTAEWTETLLFGSGRSLSRVGDVETDARMLCWREEKGQTPLATVLLDGTVATLVRGI